MIHSSQLYEGDSGTNRQIQLKPLQKTKAMRRHYQQLNVDWPMVCLHEVLDCHLFAGLKFKQFQQVLGEALHLSTMGQG